MLFGVVVQKGIDDTYLVPRGGNFLSNGMVSEANKSLEPYLTDTFTEHGGIIQPSLDVIPVPIGYKIAWVVDRDYLVTTYVFLKSHVPYDNNGTWYDTEAGAIAFRDSLRNDDKEEEHQGNKTIQLQIFQNCSDNNGVHFRVETMFPDTNTSSYDIELIDTGNPNSDAKVERTSHNTWVIRNHDSKNNGYFRVIVKRKDCKPCTYSSYSSTCNHDGQPTDCEENNRVITIGELFRAGNVISPSVQGNKLPCVVSYYNTGLTNVGSNQFRVDGFPATIHYQPDCGGDCHGWTELYQETE